MGTHFLASSFVTLILVCEGVIQMTVEEGQSIDLPCLPASNIADLGIGDYSATWMVKFNSSHVFDWTELWSGLYGTLTTVSVGIELLENLTLRIESIHLNHSGSYICSVFNTSDVNMTSDEQIHLYVIEKAIPRVGQPVVRVLGPLNVSVEWSPVEHGIGLLYTLLVRDRTKVKFRIDTREQTHVFLDHLLPNTEYQFQVLATTSFGIVSYGMASEWVHTFEAAPSGRVRIVNSTSFSDSITIDFDLPPSVEWNGNLTGFTIMYNLYGSDDDPLGRADIFIDNEQQQSFTVSHLAPFTIYDIKIAVFNQAGTGPFTEPVRIRTAEGVPSKPRILNIPTRNDTMLTVHWEQPEKSNGEVLLYNISWTSKLGSDWCQVKGLHTTHEITGLNPYTEYEIQVSAYTRVGSGPKSDVHHAITDIAAPGVPLFVNITSNKSDTVIVRWLRPETFTKQIDMYFIRYRVHNDDLFYKLLELKRFDISQDFYEEPVNNLIPNAVYEFQIAAVTRSLFTDREYVGPYSEPQLIATVDDQEEEDMQKSSNLLTLGVVSGVLCCLIILGGLIIFIISRHLIRTRYQFIADQDAGKVSAAALLLSEIYDPISCFKESIPVEKFRDHVASLHTDGDYLLSQEYEEINRMTPSNNATCQSCEEENKQKNRYLNILAYDQSRVILNQLPGKPKQSDYINANFVNGYKQTKAFIATQGPLPSTFGDFWRMVWEQESLVIVMITNLMEKGRRKCDQYWPSEGEHQYDNIAVRLLNTRITAHYTVRLFSIKHLRHKKRSGCERTVVQYHYTDWPDHGVPTFTLPSLTFVRKSSGASLNASGKGGPVIVHCSAGVGRTGTYIVIDSMIKQIKDIQSVNIFGFLCHIRNHRNYLVQTEDQYSFIHDAILEYIESGDTEVKDINLSQYLKELQTQKDDGESLLEKQYKLATSFEPKPYHLTSALAPVNETKNRSLQFLPVDITRVCLPMKAGVEGSDYINATFFQGYSKNEEYIVTQHPLTETIDDFWRMVWDQNSVTIVSLSAPDEVDFKCFWPGINETMDYDNFQVSFRREEAIGSYIVKREFILQSTQDDYECTVQMIEHSSWPDSCASSMVNVFELVQMAKVSNGQHEEATGPVIVIDRCGGNKSATFCAIAMLSDQLHREGCIDVYAVAKLYHMKRPGVFPSVDDYLFLYKVVEGIKSEMNHCGEDRDSETVNCNNCNTHLQTLPHSLSHNSVNSNHSARNSFPI